MSFSSPSKVETIGAFDNIPSQDLNSNELKTVGEGYIQDFISRIVYGKIPFPNGKYKRYGCF